MCQVTGVQLILYALLGPETRYLRQGVEHKGSDFKQEYLSFRRIDSTPLKLSEFFQPLMFAKRPSVVIPAVAYSHDIPFQQRHDHARNSPVVWREISFQHPATWSTILGTIIGSVIGEQIGGALSDFWMNRRARKIRARPPFEFRLWLSYIGYLLTIIGVVVFLVQIRNAPAFHWNVIPIVGAGVAGAGNQVVTAVLITYAVDCYREEAASVGVFITLVRQIWGFIGPFW